MEKVRLDLVEAKGCHYVIMVDRFSDYPWFSLLLSLSSRAVINALDVWFVEFEHPWVVRSEGGLQFQEFLDYCSSRNVSVEWSSTYNLEPNGLEEAEVKQIKHLILKVPTAHTL